MAERKGQSTSCWGLPRDDFFPYDPERPGRLEGFTKVLMNPPYSQSKDKTTRHLSELSFIERALSHLEVRGRLAVIVPQSAMVGKTKEDKALKAKILKHNTLDAVLTMNHDTFHGVGTHVVVALFTAGVPHPTTKKTAFVDFKDDGYKVRQHVGLTDGRAADRRKHVVEVIRDGAPDDTSFVVRSEVTAIDEWQHSYFYFNDQPPSHEDFYTTVADYLTWQVDMHTHGRGDLITPVQMKNKTGEGGDARSSDVVETGAAFPDLRFEPMFITDVFETMRSSSAWYDKTKLKQGTGLFPFVSRTKASNGIDGFTARQEKSPEPANAITIGLDT